VGPLLQLFPMPAYVGAVGQVLLHATLAAFELAPTLIVSLRRTLLDVLEARRDPAHEPLLAHVCWVRRRRRRQGWPVTRLHTGVVVRS
jgi:hypothetical protein